MVVSRIGRGVLTGIESGLRTGVTTEDLMAEESDWMCAIMNEYSDFDKKGIAAWYAVVRRSLAAPVIQGRMEVWL